jgi:hypothetical protein
MLWRAKSCSPGIHDAMFKSCASHFKETIMKRILAAAALLALSTTAQADCKTDIQTILKSLENSGPYSIEIKTESGGEKVEMTGKIILPDSVHMKSDAFEVVMTPNGVWMAQGGLLKKLPDNMREKIKGMVEQGMRLGAQAVDNAECVGSADFEGQSYALYKYDASIDLLGITSKSKVAMYVKDDGKPEWMLVDGEAMGFKSKTRQRITFDDSITISDPQ